MENKEFIINTIFWVGNFFAICGIGLILYIDIKQNQKEEANP